MATREELETALRNAAANGDMETANKIADLLYNQPPQPTPELDKARAAFDALPWYQKLPQAADDIIRRGANAVTLGAADRVAGVLGGEGAEAEQQKTREAGYRAGSAGLAADVGGALLPAGLASKGVGAMTGLAGRGLGETVAREGLAGGLQSALQSLITRGDTKEMVSEGAGGIVGGGIGGGIGSLASDAIGAVASKLGYGKGVLSDVVVPPKTAAEMGEATNKAYDAVDALGTRYDPASFNQMLNNTKAELKAANINPDIHPKATAKFKDIQSKPASTPRDIDNIRKSVSRDVTGDSGEDYMGGIMRRNLDKFTETGKTTGGTGSEAKQALDEARDLSRRTQLRQDVDKALETGADSAAARGDVNALRGVLKKEGDFMKPAEKKALRKVVRGVGMEDKIREAAKAINPVSAGALGYAITGTPFGGALGAIAPTVVRPLLRKGAQKYTDSSIDDFINLISDGSVTPSAIRNILPSAGQAAATTAVKNENERLRNKKRKPEVEMTPEQRANAEAIIRILGLE